MNSFVNLKPLCIGTDWHTISGSLQWKHWKSQSHRSGQYLPQRTFPWCQFRLSYSDYFPTRRGRRTASNWNSKSGGNLCSRSQLRLLRWFKKWPGGKSCHDGPSKYTFIHTFNYLINKQLRLIFFEIWPPCSFIPSCSFIT